MTIPLNPDPGRSTWRNAGRKSKRPDISPYQARMLAAKIVSGECGSDVQRSLIRNLAVSGLISQGSIHRHFQLEARTTQQYAHDHVVDRIITHDPGLEDILPYTSSEDRRLYCLGAVGREAARLMMGGDKSRVASVDPRKILHDLAVCEIVLRISQLAARDGWQVAGLDRKEAAVRNEAGQMILIPDAVLALTRDQELRLLAFEYHAENSSSRAAEKANTYEYIYRRGLAEKAWGPTMPWVLAVFSHEVVGHAYYEFFKTTQTVGIPFLGKNYSEVISPKNWPAGQWFYLNKRKYVTILKEENSLEPGKKKAELANEDEAADSDSADDAPINAYGW